MLSDAILYTHWWFSVGICKCKPGYKSHDLLSLVEITAFRLESKAYKGFSFKNEFSTCHVIYNTAYTYKFQLKTTNVFSYKKLEK